MEVVHTYRGWADGRDGKGMDSFEGRAESMLCYLSDGKKRSLVLLRIMMVRQSNEDSENHFLAAVALSWSTRENRVVSGALVTRHR